MDSGIGMLALQVLQIVWIDLLLSGDNAVVIAMACRSLPEEQRRWGIILGAGAAVLLRIVFAALIVQLLALPYVHVIGGVLLLWIAVQLALDEHAKHKVKSRTTLLGAVASWCAKAPIYPEFFVEIAGIIVTLGIAGILKRWRNAEAAES